MKVGGRCLRPGVEARSDLPILEPGRKRSRRRIGRSDFWVSVVWGVALGIALAIAIALVLELLG